MKVNRADVTVVGGGLAGLTSAIHLAQKGLRVIVFEKEAYPHHKVCGEYVSKEVLPYLKMLGIDIEELRPAEITRLLYSTAGGNPIESKLPLGGLGISRYAFDNFLFEKAKSVGVEIVQESVVDCTLRKGEMEVQTTGGNLCYSYLVLGAYGKRANLDKELQRPFFREKAPWLAVKAHYESSQFPQDLVALHNFKGGYCGLSKTESGVVNVCYLTTYKSFKRYKDPEKFKDNILQKNPYLHSFFSKATPAFSQPISIAQISFQPKETVNNHLLMLGDAAGLLHPLCGNGMAMAIHSAKLASETILDHIGTPSFNRLEMEKDYSMRWKKAFRDRLQTGRYLQKILLSEQLSEISQSVISAFPFLLPQIIKRTHGKPLI